MVVATVTAAAIAAAVSTVTAAAIAATATSAVATAVAAATVSTTATAARAAAAPTTPPTTPTHRGRSARYAGQAVRNQYGRRRQNRANSYCQ